MTNSTASTEQTVAAIVAERQKYEGWIAALEAKRDSTPPHVYERVHADYTARMQRASEQLVGHRAAVQDLANDLSDRLAYLDIEDVKHRDELAEAQLRSAVGEFTPEFCEDQIRKAELALKALDDERTSLSHQLARFRSILDMTQPAVPAPAPPRKPRAAEDATTLAPQAEQTARKDFDELAFLKSVVTRTEERPEVSQPRPIPAGSDRTRPQAAGSPSSSRDQSGPHAPPAAVRSPKPAPAAETEVTSREPATDEGPGVDNRRTSAREMRGTVPSYLKDVPAEQMKTLKCQECDTLNYPTEWYCERCGAELAAL